MVIQSSFWVISYTSKCYVKIGRQKTRYDNGRDNDFKIKLNSRYISFYKIYYNYISSTSFMELGSCSHCLFGICRIWRTWLQQTYMDRTVSHTLSTCRSLATCFLSLSMRWQVWADHLPVCILIVKVRCQQSLHHGWWDGFVIWSLDVR